MDVIYDGVEEDLQEQEQERQQQPTAQIFVLNSDGSLQPVSGSVPEQ